MIIPALTYLAVVLLAWTNLLSKEWLGYRLLILSLILGAVFQIVQIIITGPDSNTIAKCIGACLPYIILLLIVHSYYDKRRLLFAPLPEIEDPKHNNVTAPVDNQPKAIPSKEDAKAHYKSRIIFLVAIILVIASLATSIIYALTVRPTSETKKEKQEGPKIGIMQEYQFEKQQEAYAAEIEAAREAYQAAQEGQ